MEELRGARDERGMVTVELAMISVLVAGGALLMLWVLTQVLLIDRCQVVAHQVARQAARGDAAAVQRAMAQAPAGADVRVQTGGGATRVTVVWRVAWQGLELAPVESSATVLDEAKP